MEHVTAEGGTFAVWRFLTDEHVPFGGKPLPHLGQEGP